MVLFVIFLDVPWLEAKLIAVIHGELDDIQVLRDPSDLRDTLFSMRQWEGDRVGLIFNQTNFFSPCGGQACDAGDIKCATSQVGKI